MNASLARLALIPLVMVLALLVFVSSAFAQQTGGSFGGSSWGNRGSTPRSSRSPSPTVSASRPSPRPSARSTPSVSRPAPVRIVYTPSAPRPVRFQISRPAPAPVVVFAPAVGSSDEGPSDDGEAPEASFDASDFDPTVTGLVVGLGLVFLGGVWWRRRKARNTRRNARFPRGF